MRASNISDWYEVRIGDVAELFGGSTPSSTDITLWDGAIDWLSPSDITALQEYTVTLTQTPKTITQRGYDSCATKMLPPGTVCVSSRATVGDCIILGREACTNQGFVNVVCSDQLDAIFFLYWVRHNRNVFLRLAAGTTFDEIGRRSFRNIVLTQPIDVREQKAIGNALRMLDSSIAATRSAIRAAEKLLQSIMGEMLSGRVCSDGSTLATSEFWTHDRLGNVPNRWEVRRLRELIRLKNGKSNITANLRPTCDSSHRFPVFGGNGMTGWSDRFFLSKETVVVGRVGEYCGAIHATPPNSWVTDNALYVEERLAPLNVSFLFYLLTSLRLNRWKATTGQPKITQSEILNIRVAFPQDEDEQRAIADRLNALHDLIRAKEAKITALQRLKKSLMQNLLTGRMRLSPELIAELAGNFEDKKVATRDHATTP